MSKLQHDASQSRGASEYVVATRGSRLSIAQTNHTIADLKSKNPKCTYEITTITTRGDTDARPLFAIDQKGIFEKEVDRAVADGRADFAVHSLKDVPSTLPDGLVLACVPRRESPKDVLITSTGATLEQMPPKSIIGTSSLRRAVQITRARPDITVKPIRGNIETRIGKIGRRQGGDAQNYNNGGKDGEIIDGIILAHAGISRLRISSDIKYTVLPQDMFLPSPGQGALAIISRAKDTETAGMLKGIEHTDSRAEADAERALSETVGSGCRFPVGARAHSIKDGMRITAHAFSIEGDRKVEVDVSIYNTTPEEAGRRAGQEMLSKGADELGLKWREGLAQWNQR